MFEGMGHGFFVSECAIDTEGRAFRPSADNALFVYGMIIAFKMSYDNR
jgi:hypothetical protein